MKPLAAGLAGALISGVAMYTVGARTATVDAFTSRPALVQTVDNPYVETSQPASYTPVSYRTELRPAASAQPLAVRRTATAPQRRVSRSVAADDRELVYRTEDVRPERTWKKSALIIGGSAASGAGVGAIVDGKKGALIGAAIGGGAASIYEATRRR